MKKKLSLICFLILFIINAHAQNMNVTGASTTEVNGVYVDAGENDGVRYYQKGSIYLYRQTISSYWYIGTVLNSNDDHYYYHKPGGQTTPDGITFSLTGPLGSGPGMPAVNETSLPVELSQFSAMQQGNSVELNWTTESEVDNTGFILDRKADFTDWQTIASYQTHDALKGAGNTSSATDYTFIDEDIMAGETYSYRLTDVDFEGNVTNLDVISITLDEIPEMTELLPANPNPFNPFTKIQYTLAENADVTLNVVNMKGQTVQSIISGKNQLAGSYSVHWNGQDQSGINAPSGIYILVLNTGQIVKSQKVMLVR